MQNKKLLNLLLIIFIFQISCISDNKQNNTLNLNPQDSIEFRLSTISIIIGELRCNKKKKDSVPITITFYIDLINNTDKTLLFGSNTEYFYKGFGKYYYDRGDGSLGNFYMIHKKDTLLLYSYYSKVTWTLPNDSSQYRIGIDRLWFSNEHPQFIDFLCKIPKEKKEYQKYLYNYLKEANFIYVPVIEDYQNVIQDRYPEKKMDFIYPTQPIKIKTDSIVFLFNDSWGNQYSKDNRSYLYYEDSKGIGKTIEVKERN